MKNLLKFFTLYFVLCTLCPMGARADNLTSFGGGGGGLNNTQYNLLSNPDRGTAVSNGGIAADFGNCNAMIQRCATPKCASGGCLDMGVAVPIVSGCVEQSAECKKHGDALIQAIAAQIVASNTAKANNAAAASAQALADAQATQSAAQLEQMSAQMQSMQQQMAAERAETAAQMQAALAQQRAANEAMMAEQAAAMASAQTTIAANTPSSMVTTAAVDSGLSADMIARKQVIGQVMSSLDGVDTGLSALKKTVEDVREYAGCDFNATGCTGPKRVAAFKRKALGFFETYDGVLDSLEDSLSTAMAAGVDITEIYMMLNNTCSQWGTFLCNDPGANPILYCNENNVPDFNSAHGCVTSPTGTYKIQFRNPNCNQTGIYRNDQRSEVQQNFIISMEEDQSRVRMACLGSGTDVIQSGLLGGRRRAQKKNTDFDMYALEIILRQDEDRVFQENADAITRNCKAEDKIVDLEAQIRNKSYKDLLGSFSDNTFSASSDDDEWANPMYAMCSTHAYNMGVTTNDQIERKKMEETIALKATVIVQQLKKENDFLASTVKQMKTLLQRSVMVAQAEASGASSSSQSAAGPVAGQIDCRFRPAADVVVCVRNNLSGLQQLAQGGNSSQFKQAATLNISAIQSASQDIGNKIGNGCDNTGTKQGREACVVAISGLVNDLDAHVKGNSRSTMPMMWGTNN